MIPAIFLPLPLAAEGSGVQSGKMGCTQPTLLAGPDMRILGIDPGLRSTGFGLIHKQGNKLAYIASGTIKTPDASLPERLKVILDSVAEVIQTYQPDCAAIE